MPVIAANVPRPRLRNLNHHWLIINPISPDEIMNGNFKAERKKICKNNCCFFPLIIILAVDFILSGLFILFLLFGPLASPLEIIMNVWGFFFTFS